MTGGFCGESGKVDIRLISDPSSKALTNRFLPLFALGEAKVSDGRAIRSKCEGQSLGPLESRCG